MGKIQEIKRLGQQTKADTKELAGANKIKNCDMLKTAPGYQAVVKYGTMLGMNNAEYPPSSDDFASHPTPTQCRPQRQYAPARDNRICQK
jgi:hypothetical protein